VDVPSMKPFATIFAFSKGAEVKRNVGWKKGMSPIYRIDEMVGRAEQGGCCGGAKRRAPQSRRCSAAA
jgi:hypothetical protein